MADLSGSIPLATPYPWSPDELECYKSLSNVKRREKASRYAASQLSSNTMSTAAECMLENLLKQHDQTTKETEKEPIFKQGFLMANTIRNGDSLFMSLLRIISQDTPATTKHILRLCSLSANPGQVPPHMDCKEYVMAALFFLSSCIDMSSDEFCELPLLEAAQPQDDLEKRTYQKIGGWSLDDATFVRKLHALEQVFSASGNDWKCLGRHYHLPLGIAEKDKETLLLKGMLPKKEGTKKRKASTTKRREETQTSPAAPSNANLENATMAASLTSVDQE